MIFSNLTIFMISMMIILTIMYIYQINFDNFKSNINQQNQQNQQYQPVNYNSLTQNCDQLTWTPSKCTVKTVIPKIKNVCGKNLTPITNNQKEIKEIKEKTPNLSLDYNFDLLSSFNKSQIKNNDDLNNTNLNNLEFKNDFVDNDKINDKPSDKNNYDLVTDIRSIGSLENDLISNY